MKSPLDLDVRTELFKNIKKIRVGLPQFTLIFTIDGRIVFMFISDLSIHCWEIFSTVLIRCLSDHTSLTFSSISNCCRIEGYFQFVAGSSFIEVVLYGRVQNYFHTSFEISFSQATNKKWHSTTFKSLCNLIKYSTRSQGICAVPLLNIFPNSSWLRLKLFDLKSPSAGLKSCSAFGSHTQLCLHCPHVT